MQAEDGEKLKEISGGIRGAHFPFAYHHEGERFAATRIFEPARMLVWPLGDGQPGQAAALAKAPVRRVSFSTDGSRLVFTHGGLVAVRLLGPDPRDRTLEVSEDEVPLAALAPGGDVLVASGKALRAYRLEDLDEVGE